MADIRRKRATPRRAVAVGELQAGATGFAAIAGRTLPKGDALAMAEVAGIQGAKQAAMLMPLCHPLALEYVDVRCEPVAERHAVRVYCETALTARTGVEMEALAGASAALLTLYDLTKPVEPALSIGGVRLLFKEGGKKGLWIHPDGMTDAERAHYRPCQAARLDGVDATVITLSDRAASGVYEDRSGPVAAAALRALGANVRRAPCRRRPCSRPASCCASAAPGWDRATSRPKRWTASRRARCRDWPNSSAPPAPSTPIAPGSAVRPQRWSASGCSSSACRAVPWPSSRAWRSSRRCCRTRSR
jgi:molybdenum cofactor biosynthesis protein MoaC